MKVAIIHNQDAQGVINTFGMQNKEKYNPKTVRGIAESLEQNGHNVKVIDGNMKVIDNLQEYMPRVIEGERMGIVFNMAYGIQGESRYTHLPSLLEMLGIPYVGSTPSGHALALDKVITKVMMQKHGISTPPFWVFSNSDEDMSQIAYPVIVKPKMEAVSFGLRIVTNENDLKEAVDFVVTEFNQQALVEQFIRGREFCVGLLGNRGNLEAFPVLEIDLDNDPDGIQTVDDKKAKPRAKICPANISEELATEMVEMSKAAFLALELRDFARIDIRMDENENIYLLEINSMASLGDTGSYVHAAAVAGYNYQQLVNKILDTAVVRYSYDLITDDQLVETETNHKNKPATIVRIRSFIRNRQSKLERLLMDLVNINSHVRNLDGVNSVGNLIWKQLSSIGFSQQVIPQVEIGNLLLFSNASVNHYDVLFVTNIDGNVSFTKHRPFDDAENRLWGTSIWTSKGGIAVLTAALQSLRFLRVLRKLNIGILMTTDENLQGKFSQSTIEHVSSKADIVIGLKGGDPQSALVTSRSGAAVYKCEMNLTKARDAKDVANAVGTFSQITSRLAELTDESKGIVVAPNMVTINSNVSDLHASGELSLSVRFNQMDLIDDIDRKIRQVATKRKSNKYLKTQIEGGIRRPPLTRTSQVESLWNQLKNLAKRLDLRLLEEHRWSSTNLCFASNDKKIIDGIGPLGGLSSSKGEFILKHSLFDRAVLLATFLNDLAEGKK